MNKAVLAALMRRKLAMMRAGDKSADAFATAQERAVRRQLTAFFGKLQTRIITGLNNGGKFAAADMVRDLQISLDLSSVPDIYEKAAMEMTEYIKEAKALIQKWDFSFFFDEKDDATLEMIRNSFFWMKADHTDVLIEEVKKIIESAFSGEIARDALAKYLEDKFGSIVQAESRYFKDVCDHIISQGQNMARVNQGSKYDVRWYKVMARMDARTTQFCRSVHNKIISAEHVEKQSKKILAARNSYEKKNAAAWPKKDGPLEGRLPANIGIPPYHYRCRTILQPYWPEEGDEGQVISGGRLRLPEAAKSAVESALDKAGDEIRGKKTEHCRVFDDAGRLVFKKRGGKKSISFSTDEVEKIKNGYFTHNHPDALGYPESDPRSDGNSFSDLDMFFACRYNLKEMRAESKKYRHIARPNGTWPDESKLKAAFKDAEKSVRDEFTQAIDAGKMTTAHANAEFWHEIWKRVAQKTGIFYERKEVKYA